MMRVLKAKEWKSTDTPALARGLLGRVLAVRTDEGGVLRRRIVETEAYHTVEDRACHASRGLTARTAVIFGPAGAWYVYLCYGMHEMLNLVTGPEGHAGAVLIRGVEGAIGPGRLTKALGIDRRFNARPAMRATGLWIEDDGWRLPAGREILSGPRVGIDYAGPEWVGKQWRYWLEEPAGTRSRLR